ncbi:hypothetical protein HPT27_13050 [Permianibacter sp. IMCC34836]|uniref:hypothetical protein n=1 Tax=Permianibacter fluminis TaxID=2738515 RepID=UPI00155314C2|nr:hypothetical protein [Permianibacter fluminis]NQD37952.1 hypothetical protein [Permianibacter fluminis]
MLKARNIRRLQRGSLLVAALFMLALQLLWACNLTTAYQTDAQSSEHAAVQHVSAHQLPVSEGEHDCCPVKPAAHGACQGDCQLLDNVSPKLELSVVSVVAAVSGSELAPELFRTAGVHTRSPSSNAFIPRPRLTILFQVLTI